MEQYSHGAFQVTGYKITTTKKNNKETQDIENAWAKFMSEKMGDKILHKAYPHLHMVYFNYVNANNLLERRYDMIMGYVTEDNSVQEDVDLVTIHIPAQDYEYIKFTDASTYKAQWQKVNAMSKEECNRSFGYDMDMYSEDMSEVTLAVSVNK
jgi:predicted transcriptional regulator YdeE